MTNQLLQEAAASGLRGITLFKTQDGRWQASVSLDMTSWSVRMDKDPAAALALALSVLKKDETIEADEGIFG